MAKFFFGISVGGPTASPLVGQLHSRLASPLAGFTRKALKRSVSGTLISWLRWVHRFPELPNLPADGASD